MSFFESRENEFVYEDLSDKLVSSPSNNEFLKEEVKNNYNTKYDNQYNALMSDLEKYDSPTLFEASLLSGNYNNGAHMDNSKAIGGPVRYTAQEGLSCQKYNTKPVDDGQKLLNDMKEKYAKTGQEVIKEQAFKVYHITPNPKFRHNNF